MFWMHSYGECTIGVHLKALADRSRRSGPCSRQFDWPFTAKYVGRGPGRTVANSV